ncbi:hypothetical protein F511_43549 [Dorcoceras hygrometricum]|uniref:Uncharacterized protein n=1 Tax=Dorcoceras hygrometricum TaxID=472368 RepID=A0A2Z7BLN5_9LAMI|nr:hypothetical protein F511_43549 [Dorcoceras hygrometricum]
MRIGFWGVRLPKSQPGSNRDFPTLQNKTVILHWGSEKWFFRLYYSVLETEFDRSDLIGDRSYDEVTVVGMNRMFTRWTRGKTVILHWGSEKWFFRLYYSVLETEFDRSDLIGDWSYDEVTVVGMNRMFTRWTRAPWAALNTPPPPSQIAAVGRRPTPLPPSPSSPEIRSGQFDQENPSAQISSVLLLQADEGISSPVVDLIGVIYRSLP